MAFGSNFHKALRKMIWRRLTVSAPFVTHEGTMVRSVNGCLLTNSQILELDSKNELTSWGIREFAKRFEEEHKAS